MKLTLTPTTAQELSEVSLQFVQPQAQKKQVQLIEQLPADLPDLQVDERRIRQVLINLLTNAVKFTPEGGTVTIRAALVSPAEGLTYSQMRLEVSDTGIGISPENLQKLFKPFIQIDSALNRNYGGTGLGLSLVKSIVELHGGAVGVSSEEGVGSCFWFTVPCVETPLHVLSERVDNLENVEPAVIPSATQSVFSPPKKQTAQPILLVARDLKSLISIESYLTAKGYFINVVTLAMAIAARIGQSPQCLVLVLEQGNDPEFLALIHSCRQCPPLSQTPIIVTLPNSPGKIDPQPYLAAGANHYLEPSSKLRDLAHCLQQLTS